MEMTLGEAEDRLFDSLLTYLQEMEQGWRIST